MLKKRVEERVERYRKEEEDGEEPWNKIKDKVFLEGVEKLRILYQKFYELNIHKGLLNYQIKKREWLVEKEYLQSRRNLIDRSIKSLNPNDHSYGKQYYRLIEDLEENTLQIDMNRVKEPLDSERMEVMLQQKDEYLIEFERIREKLSKKYNVKIPTYIFNPGTLSKEFKPSCITCNEEEDVQEVEEEED